jgi:hypothetical protein
MGHPDVFLDGLFAFFFGPLKEPRSALVTDRLELRRRVIKDHHQRADDRREIDLSMIRARHAK